MITAARDRAVDLGFAAGWGVVKALPEPVSARAFRAAADLAASRNGPAVRQLRRNLRRVVGAERSELAMDELVRQAMRSYARYWLETFRLPAMDIGQIAERAGEGMIGAHHIVDAMAAGNGLILALPHMGNWDVAATWMIEHGYPFTTVAERLKPESLFDRFVAYRESLGMEVLPLTGGQRPPTDVLVERLRAGRCICLVGDRDLSHSGVEVDFFGERASMPPGPSMLAAMTGATLLPVALWFTDGPGWRQWVGPPIELAGARLRDKVRSGTQQLADHFAARIAEHPADWHMLQKFWLADLTPRATAAVGG